MRNIREWMSTNLSNPRNSSIASNDVVKHDNETRSSCSILCRVKVDVSGSNVVSKHLTFSLLYVPLPLTAIWRSPASVLSSLITFARSACSIHTFTPSRWLQQSSRMSFCSWAFDRGIISTATGQILLAIATECTDDVHFQLNCTG